METLPFDADIGGAGIAVVLALGLVVLVVAAPRIGAQVVGTGVVVIARHGQARRAPGRGIAGLQSIAHVQIVADRVVGYVEHLSLFLAAQVDRAVYPVIRVEGDSGQASLRTVTDFRAIAEDAVTACLVVGLMEAETAGAARVHGTWDEVVAEVAGFCFALPFCALSRVRAPLHLSGTHRAVFKDLVGAPGLLLAGIRRACVAVVAVDGRTAACEGLALPG